MAGRIGLTRAPRVRKPLGDFLELRGDVEEIHQLGIELPAGLTADDFDALSMRKRFFVNATGGEGVVDVGNRHDTGRQRDVFARDAVRVSGAVPAP